MKNLLFWLVILLSNAGCRMLPDSTTGLPPLPANYQSASKLTIGEAKESIAAGSISAIEFDTEHSRHQYAFAMSPQQKTVEKEGVYNRLNYRGGEYSLWQERAADLFQSLEYWLIEHTKIKVLNDYKYSRKPAFNPFLTGGKEGYGTLFPLEDLDSWSYKIFYTYLNEQTDLDDDAITHLMHVCFPDMSQYILKTDEVDKLRMSDYESRCANLIDNYETGYDGVPRGEPANTEIIEEEQFENEPFERSLYAHMLGADGFQSIKNPAAPVIMLHLANSVLYKPSNAARRYPDPSNLPDLATFAVGSAYSLFNDKSLATSMRSINAIGFVRNGGLSKLPKQNIFDQCRRFFKINLRNVAYEHFVHRTYYCNTYDLEMRGRASTTRYFGGFSANVDFWVLDNWKYDYLHRSGLEKAPGVYALMSLNDGWDEPNVANSTPRTEQSVVMNMMRMSPAHYFYAWTDVQDERIIGNVLHYGKHYKYDVTDLAKLMLHTQNIASH